AGNNSSTDTTHVIARADLSIAKSNTPDPVTAGQSLTYTIVVTNNGPSDAQNVQVTDALPSQLTGATYCDTTGCTPSAPWTGSDSLGTIVAGGSRTITIQATIKANTPDGSSFDNTASVSSPTTDPGPSANSSTDTTHVIARADLSITKSHTPEPVTAGAAITYTIVVTNNGASDAQSASLTDAMPSQTIGATYCIGSSCNPSTGSPWTGSLSLGTLAAGSSTTVKIQATVKSNTPDGSAFDNTATVSSTTADPGPSPNSSTDTAHVVALADL